MQSTKSDFRDVKHRPRRSMSKTVESAIGEKANAPTPAELVRRANALPEVEAKLAEAVEWCQLFAKYPRMLGDKQVVGNLRAFLARMEP